jgi:hypothetical protein
MMSQRVGDAVEGMCMETDEECVCLCGKGGGKSSGKEACKWECSDWV